MPRNIILVFMSGMVLCVALFCSMMLIAIAFVLCTGRFDAVTLTFSQLHYTRTIGVLVFSFVVLSLRVICNLFRMTA